ncbi:phosphatidylserine decarboxylase [Parasphingopyxis marina]|uniref:Phosphatidylserine decarboxylase proenzyme n=1 Tax=Parasphingopyxis marina TaxID=2761622 RepID=A0A842HZQ2_9SPHN|nr:phosphatidylserine decarboxylase [Parasphingopyxis marina]MBC2777859.1 phosphatidylserine decarboxylase [Parasphingopyxis marina]
MTELQKPPGDDRNVRWQWPSVHPESYKYLAVTGVAIIIFMWLGWGLIAWPLIGLAIWIATFFRDPVRVTPTEEGVIVAPADGLITLIREVAPPREMAGPDGLGDEVMTRVSIFMSVFDVHINRAPVGGTIREVIYISGKFVNADLDKASEDNERQHILVEMRDGSRIGFTQIAGLVARRIVPWVKPGDMVVAGQRIGLIRFGSRVDVYLPAGTAPLVALGQKTVAGETIVARIGQDSRAFGVSQ